MTTPAGNEKKAPVVTDQKMYCDPNGYGADSHAEAWEKLAAPSTASSLSTLTMPVGDFRPHVTDYPDTMAAIKA